MRRLLFSLARCAASLGALVSIVVLSAQTPTKPAPPLLPAPPAVDLLTKTRAELAGTAEQLATARVQLSLCQGQLAPQVFRDNLQEVAAERQKIVDAFEAANPGYTIDVKTLAVTKKPPKAGGGL